MTVTARDNMVEQLALDGHHLHVEHIDTGKLWSRTPSGAYRRRDGRFGIRQVRMMDPKYGHKVSRWRLFGKVGDEWMAMGMYWSLAAAKSGARDERLRAGR